MINLKVWLPALLAEVERRAALSSWGGVRKDEEAHRFVTSRNRENTHNDRNHGERLDALAGDTIDLGARVADLEARITAIETPKRKASKSKARKGTRRVKGL